MTESPTTTPTVTAATPPRLAFRPTQKLRRARDFERARRGKRCGDALFGLQYVTNDCGHARLGMAVGVRTVGNAVKRNRVRRLIRESFRLHQHELPPVDVFVSARAALRDAAGPAIYASLQRAWRQIRP